MNIPIYIICYNNGFYAENTINQLKSKSISNELIIINNNSDDDATIDILKKLSCSHKVINLEKNYGHRVWAESIIFDNLPEYFIVTDPDLEYNSDLPDDFINTLYEISILHSASKVGLALNIEAPDLFNDPYIEGMTVKEWESQFWKNPLQKYKNLDLYAADIDTTFFLGCKSRLAYGFSSSINIRVGSSFTSKHLPWHIEHNDTLNKDTLMKLYSNNNTSTTGGLIKKYYNF